MGNNIQTFEEVERSGIASYRKLLDQIQKVKDTELFLSLLQLAEETRNNSYTDGAEDVKKIYGKYEVIATAHREGNTTIISPLKKAS